MMWLLYARSVFLRVVKSALAYPWQFALIIALAACGYLYMGKADALATVAKRDATIAAMTKASEEARAAQIAMNAERTKKETNNADQSDKRYIVAQDVAGRAATSYIDRWRVRPNNSCSGPDTATKNSDPEVPAEMPANPVLVSERDVQACTGATAYAIEAHNHAVSQIEAGVAQ